MNKHRPYVESETLKNYIINTTHQASDHVQGKRVKSLVIHYTADSFETALAELTGQDPSHLVSVHYLVADKLTTHVKQYIYQLVDEENRAWHAGLGYWDGRTDLNTASIGIEIVNLDGNTYPYPEKQIAAVIELAGAIVKKYAIEPCNVIGHSDLAPTRKVDPGTLFPWKRLYENGIGAWPDDVDVQNYMEINIPPLRTVQTQLHQYGYGIDITGPEVGDTAIFVEAFQRHFRPSKVDGVIDNETYAILRALLKKYKNVSTA